MTRLIGRYEVVGHLADGGMAEILLGRLSGPRGFEYPVVIKRILPHLARSAEFVDMFTDEASILAEVRHRNVVTVHEFGREGEELFLALEYLEGESVGSLARRLWTRAEALDRRLAAYVIAEACAGLHAAHELRDEHGVPRDLVHRDVSPQNVLITYAGEVKILDFGIAKAHKRHTRTEVGQLKGKMGYMSPEQVHGKPLDRRSDIFALGTLLYELTTSRRLFRRDNELDTLKAITEQPVVPPSAFVPAYPRALEAICMRALERRREDRYTTAAEMRRELLALIHTLGGALPEEDLGTLMQRVFADRMGEKRELMRLVRAGSGVSHIPIAEADETVEFPTVDEPLTSATRATFAAPPSPRRPVGWLSLGALIVLGSAAAAVWWSTRPTETAAVQQTVQPPVPSSAPPAVSDVVVNIETTPPGAKVIVSGRVRGTTPARLTLPRGSEAIAIELQRDGYELATERVVPEVDQRLVVNLRPRITPRPPPRAAPSASAKTTYEKL